MNTKLQKQITGEIYDASGHTDWHGSLQDAVTTIMDNCKKFGKWAYINGNPFIFESYNDAEAEQVYNLLDASEEPSFVLTGAVVGGVA
jgi:hypothetical protein